MLAKEVPVRQELIPILSLSHVAGHLMDVTVNGDIPFLVFGLVQACGGLVGFVVYFMARRQERRQESYKRIWNQKPGIEFQEHWVKNVWSIETE